MQRQQTLAGVVEYSGIGVHSGTPVTARLCPAPEDHGIVFVRTDIEGRPEIRATIDNVAPQSLARQTTIALPGNPDARVATVEHVLASLHGFGIDNCRIEIDGPEAPFTDGSAKDLAEAIARRGIATQESERKLFEIAAPFAFAEGGVEIVAVPSPVLRLTFFIDYPGTMIGKQAQTLLVSPETFLNGIAPARTFCLKREIDFLREKGLIKGGTMDSALIVDGDRLLNPGTVLRFEDEFVRHKILDLLGDLYLLGRPLRAHVLAVKSGHVTHAEFVRRLCVAAMGSKRARATSAPAQTENGTRGRPDGLAEQDERKRKVNEATAAKALNVQEIMNRLPHRYPFLMVDRVLELEPGKRGVGIKNVTANEPHFQGHFPGNPIMPGVLIVEAMAQLGGVVVSATNTEQNEPRIAYLAGVDRAKFRRMVVPGDQLRIEVEVILAKPLLGKVKGRASVNGEVAAEAEILFVFESAAK